ncbi:MAG: hypothetical protein DWQ05_21585 [Calditrichaeota bacterium]|nr:MAG: hypothetical protein DWQ05_21585 [Calditrichota bacterium]
MIDYIKQAGTIRCKNKRLILFYFAASLLLSLIVVMPLRSFMSRFLGSSLMRSRLESGIDVDFLIEFWFHSPGFTAVLVPLLLLVFVSYLCINLVFSAGTIGLFLQDKAYESSFFWGIGGSYFWRFLRITLWSALLFIILMALSVLLGNLRQYFHGDDPLANISFYWRWARIAFRFLCFGYVMMVIDYARIFTVQTDEKRMYRAVLHGMYFVLRNFSRTVPLALFYLICGLLLFAIYYYASPLIAYRTGFLAVLILFLIQQSFIFLRMVLKVSLMASEVLLYKDCSERLMQKKYAKNIELRPVVPPSL